MEGKFAADATEVDEDIQQDVTMFTMMEDFICNVSSAISACPQKQMHDAFRTDDAKDAIQNFIEGGDSSIIFVEDASSHGGGGKITRTMIHSLTTFA